MKTTITLQLERETKGTVRYREVDDKGNDPDAPVVRTLYVAKSALDGERPPTLTLTVTG